MNVKSVNNVSLLNFEGKSRRKENKPNVSYPQMDAPASKTSSKSMRDLMMGLMLLGAAAGGSTVLQSCDKYDLNLRAESAAATYASAKAWHICDCYGSSKPDTIINTVPIKDLNFALNDSLISQGENIGAILNGPEPGEGRNVIFWAGQAHERYDDITYNVQTDSTGTNNKQQTLISRIVDRGKDGTEENPKITWMKTVVSDVPGKGIKLTRYYPNAGYQPSISEAPSDSQWKTKPEYYEIRSNGSRGNRPGENTVYNGEIYDEQNELVWQGTFNKGQQEASFFYGTLALKDGKPDLDNPETINYTFDDAEMWSREVKFE